MNRDKADYKRAMERLAELMISTEVPPLLAQIDRCTGELRRKVAAVNATNEDLQRTIIAQRGQIDELDSLRSQMAQLTTEQTGLAAECKRLRQAMAEADRNSREGRHVLAHEAIWHHTVNTQHGRWSGRNEVDSAVIAKLQSLVPQEQGQYSFTIHEIPLRVQITTTENGAMWTVFAKAKKPHGLMPRAAKEAVRKELPLVSCGLARTPEERRTIWDHLIALATHLPRFPPSVGYGFLLLTHRCPTSFRCWRCTSTARLRHSTMPSSLVVAKG